MKICRDCGAEKPLEDFHKQPGNRDGRSGHCKGCAIVRARAYYAKNRDRMREINRKKAQELRDRDPRVKERERATKLMNKYGITLDDWDRLYDEQLGRCAICLCTLADVKTCVDHDHKTGKVRGLLCNTCNQGLGYFGDDVVRLARAQAYLDGATAVADREEVMQQ